MLNKIIEELEAEPSARKLGQGWISGVVGFLFAFSAFGTFLCLVFPNVFTVPELSENIGRDQGQWILKILTILGFIFSITSLILRQNRTLGFISILMILIVVTFGGGEIKEFQGTGTQYHFGMDWFILNLTFTGLLFVPLERMFKRIDQEVFRDEWIEDLFYFFVSSVLVNFLTFLTSLPSETLNRILDMENLKATIASQPVWLQVIEIMFFTDLVQYWVHRIFHQVKFLWRFHAIHHSAKKMDWLAGSRMHFFEIIVLRGLTVIPMTILGFSTAAVYAYLLVVFITSTYIHANLRWNIEFLKPFIVTPRFHHWHHGIEEEAIDINFSIHFPIFDRIFGTYHMPKERWPSGYGVQRHQIPKGYLKQFAYPFVEARKKKS